MSVLPVRRIDKTCQGVELESFRDCDIRLGDDRLYLWPVKAGSDNPTFAPRSGHEKVMLHLPHRDGEATGRTHGISISTLLSHLTPGSDSEPICSILVVIVQPRGDC
jgi:hypothetical protein